jgi:hypothetical protein
MTEAKFHPKPYLMAWQGKLHTFFQMSIFPVSG